MPKPVPYTSYFDGNHNQVLDLEDWVNIGTITPIDPQHRELHLSVCEPARDYFRASSGITRSPLGRLRELISRNPRIAPSGETEKYIRQQQALWRQRHTRP